MALQQVKKIALLGISTSAQWFLKQVSFSYLSTLYSYGIPWCLQFLEFSLNHNIHFTLSEVGVDMVRVLSQLFQKWGVQVTI